MPGRARSRRVSSASSAASRPGSCFSRCTSGIRPSGSSAARKRPSRLRRRIARARARVRASWLLRARSRPPGQSSMSGVLISRRGVGRMLRSLAARRVRRHLSCASLRRRSSSACRCRAAATGRSRACRQPQHARLATPRLPSFFAVQHQREAAGDDGSDGAGPDRHGEAVDDHRPAERRRASSCSRASRARTTIASEVNGFISLTPSEELTEDAILRLRTVHTRPRKVCVIQRLCIRRAYGHVARLPPAAGLRCRAYASFLDRSGWCRPYWLAPPTPVPSPARLACQLRLRAIDDLAGEQLVLESRPPCSSSVCSCLLILLRRFARQASGLAQRSRSTYSICALRLRSSSSAQRCAAARTSALMRSG